MLSLHWQIPFLLLSRPPGLLAGFVSCKTKRWFLWIGRPVRSCNCSKALNHVRRKELQLLFAVWMCYIVGFVIFVVIVFGGDKPIKDNLDKAKFFGPNILKTTLCLALVIMSLLSSTGRDCIVYRDLIWQLPLRMTLDLVQMLVIIEENE